MKNKTFVETTICFTSALARNRDVTSFENCFIFIYLFIVCLFQSWERQRQRETYYFFQEMQTYKVILRKGYETAFASSDVD